MRITIPVRGDNDTNAEAAEKAGLKNEAALDKFVYVGQHQIEYDVNPETGAAVPVKIDGRSILSEPIKGVVPDYLRERMMPGKSRMAGE